MRSDSMGRAAAAVIAVIVASGMTAAETVDVVPLERLARQAGLRVLAGRHLSMATDRPVRPGDGVDELPAVFDAAFAAWCRHYGMNPADHAGWRCFGCLVVDRERFRTAGLLPDTIPRFENGFCANNRFWLVDQSNPAYRRHLLLHEGVHAFTLTLRNLATPVWYNEGIAELLATHRLEPRSDGTAEFVPTPIPDRPADVEQLGRIEKLRELRGDGQAPALDEVFGLAVGEHGSIGDYAASWAAVAMLSGHPAYARPFAMLERGPLGPDFNRRLAALPGWDAARAGRDFDAFTADVDYGWDFDRMAIDWKAGPLLAGPHEMAVDASRGWQNVGVSLAAGRRYAFKAGGRVSLGSVSDTASDEATAIESEADGVSLEWYRCRPAGRLLVGQWLAVPADGGRPRFVVIAEGACGEFAALADGPLQVRLNGTPERLAECEGTLDFSIRPLR